MPWFTPNPAPGLPITSQWGNAIENASVPFFATLAALNAGWTDAPDGAHAAVIANGRLYNRVGGQWVMTGSRGLIEQVTIPASTGLTPGAQFIPGAVFTVPAGRMCKIEMVIQLVPVSQGDMDVWLQSGGVESFHRISYYATGARRYSVFVSFWPQSPGAGAAALNVPGSNVDVSGGQIDVIDFGPTP